MPKETSIRGKVAKGLFWTYAERISAQAVSFIVSIILARIIDPEHYGVITLVNVFINIANVFVSDSFGNALIQKKDADALDFSTVFYINLAVSLVLYALIFAAAPFIANFYKEPQASPVLRVLSVKLVLASLNSVQNAYISRSMKFRKFFFATLVGTVISAVVGIWMAYAGYGVWALVGQYLTNSLIDTIFLHFTCGWHPQLMFSKERAKGLAGFGSRLLVAALIQKLYENMRSLIIGKIFSAKDLSFYDRGKRFPALIVDNINTSISKTLFPALSMVQDNKERLLQMTRRSIRVSAYLLSPLLVGLAVCGKSFVSLILTDKWLGCVPFLQIISITYLFMPMHKANLQAIKAVGRSDIILRLEYIKKAFGIAAVLVAAFVFRSTIAIAWSFLVATLFNAVVNAWPNAKLLNYTIKEQFADLLPNFGAAAIMGGLVWCVQLFELKNWITLAIQIAVGVLSYLAISILFRMESFIYVKDAVKSLLKRKSSKI